MSLCINLLHIIIDQNIYFLNFQLLNYIPKNIEKTMYHRRALTMQSSETSQASIQTVQFANLDFSGVNVCFATGLKLKKFYRTNEGKSMKCKMLSNAKSSSRIGFQRKNSRKQFKPENARKLTEIKSDNNENILFPKNDVNTCQVMKDIKSKTLYQNIKNNENKGNFIAEQLKHKIKPYRIALNDVIAITAEKVKYIPSNKILPQKTNNYSMNLNDSIGEYAKNIQPIGLIRA